MFDKFFALCKIKNEFRKGKITTEVAKNQLKTLGLTNEEINKELEKIGFKMLKEVARYANWEDKELRRLG